MSQLVDIIILEIYILGSKTFFVFVINSDIYITIQFEISLMSGFEVECLKSHVNGALFSPHF